MLLGTPCAAIPKRILNVLTDQANIPCEGTPYMPHHYFVYLMSNRSHTLYVAVTNDLQRRVNQHKQKLIEGISAR